MSDFRNDKRKHSRFETDVQVHFQVPYDMRAEVDFSLKQEIQQGQLHKYIGFSKNISVQGLCFESNKELAPGDVIWAELHLPDHKKIVYMQGEVRWCHLSVAIPEAPRTFLTGLLIQKVNGMEVEQTVYFDQTYRVMWSQLLEEVLGAFARNHKKSIKQ